MKPFRERDPVPIGLIGVAVMLVMVYLSFHAASLPFLGGGGTVYRADFTQAGNLKKDSEVRIAGVKVGKVISVGLDGDHVLVKFRMKKQSDLGTSTRASIRIKTLVGAEYLAIEPDGPGTLSPATDIPVSRTDSPFAIQDAFGDLSKTVDHIDTDQLAKAFETLSDTFKDTPDNVQAALTGLSRLSKTVASRDQQLQDLLTHAGNVTDVLAKRNAQLTMLISDGDLVLQTLDQRREVINQLLKSTSDLSAQLSGLVHDNRAALKPLLTNLQGVIGVLQKDSAQLYRTVQLLGPFVRVFTNTLGNGHWFDTYIDTTGLQPGLRIPTMPSPAGASK
jgi:phospholipid/cholesterol/gamma-HCH transport system substrate-binding protein